jgi:hypothetical protein
MSLPIYPLSLSLFFSLLFCTCVMGATTWNQHNGGWDFTDSATVFPFFFSDKRGIKNTHIATWTDGWMDGKLDLPVPASSTPATSKEDYTHIRSFWLISPIQSTRSGSTLRPCTYLFFPFIWLTDYYILFLFFFIFDFRKKRENGHQNSPQSPSLPFFKIQTEPKSDEPRSSTSNRFTFAMRRFTCGWSYAIIQMSQTGRKTIVKIIWTRQTRAVGKKEKKKEKTLGKGNNWTTTWTSRWIINVDPNLKLECNIGCGIECYPPPPNTHTHENPLSGLNHDTIGRWQTGEAVNRNERKTKISLSTYNSTH